MGFNCLKGFNCHFEETVYFLPLSPWKFLVLTLLTLEKWKAESTLEPTIGFERRIPVLEIWDWRWPDFSGLTIFNFINHYKVTFSSARTCLNFPTSLAYKTCAVPFDFTSERDLKNILLSAWHRELYGPGPQFFVIWLDMNIDTHRIFRSVILVSILMLRVYLTFSLFFKIWLTESILISRQKLFRGTCFLLVSNTLHHKIFLM